MIKHISKSAVKARADRLNQPEMIQAYSDMAITETATHYELIEDDWRELNTRWKETNQPSTRRKPCTTCQGL